MLQVMGLTSLAGELDTEYSCTLQVPLHIQQRQGNVRCGESACASGVIVLILAVVCRAVKCRMRAAHLFGPCKSDWLLAAAGVAPLSGV